MANTVTKIKYNHNLNRKPLCFCVILVTAKQTHMYVSAESKSSGTTHTFMKENYSPRCQKLLLKEYFCFLFLYAPTMIHPTMGRMLVLNKPTKTTTSQNTSSKNQPGNFHFFHTIILGNTFNTDTIYTEKMKLPFS